MLRSSGRRGDYAPRPAEELSRTEPCVLRYLPTNLTRLEIASELSVFAEHRQHAYPGELRQARCRRPVCGSTARPRAAAAPVRPSPVARDGIRRSPGTR